MVARDATLSESLKVTSQRNSIPEGEPQVLGSSQERHLPEAKGKDQQRERIGTPRGSHAGIHRFQGKHSQTFIARTDKEITKASGPVTCLIRLSARQSPEMQGEYSSTCLIWLLEWQSHSQQETTRSGHTAGKAGRRNPSTSSC